MKMSAAGLATLIRREGLRLRAYRDTVGVWTIGVGHTGRAAPPPVKAGLAITRARATAILSSDLAPMEARITALLKRPIPQGAFDALCSLAFNIGIAGFTHSTVLRKLNAGDHAGAGRAMLLWNKPPEVLGRRKAERSQFLQAFATPTGDAAACPKPAPAAPPIHAARSGASVRAPSPVPPALPPTINKELVMKNKVPFLVALLLALFGVSAANAGDIDFAPVANAAITYLAVPVFTALAAWLVAEASLLLRKVAARYPAYLDQKSADLLASNVSGVLDKAIAYGAAQAGTMIGRADLHANVDGWVASYAAQYAVNHAPDLMKQAGDITQKIVARLAEHPAVQELKAQVDAAQPLAAAA